MAGATIQVKGADRVVRLFKNLPKNLDNEGDKLTYYIVKSLQRRARLRASEFTGRLKEKIIARKTKKGSAILEVSSPYAMAQEFGFTPHWIPIEYIEQHIGGQSKGKYVNDPKGFIWVTWKNGPFLRPAVDSLIKDLNKMVSNSARNAIRKSRR